ncbi:hypothetical protein U9M48_016250 [Paspalum notatum var. saurae]|uniref:Uncharacterized protein n=1 Tax=Paspalum notatum var. saurae TaxID=547442 RepID=A0AAQ3T665_PASNO
MSTPTQLQQKSELQLPNPGLLFAAIQAAGIPVQAIHCVDDRVVPVECSTRHLKAKLPTARLRVIDGCDHTTVVLGPERDFVDELRAFWWSALGQ